MLASGLGCVFTAYITKLPFELVVMLALVQLDAQRPVIDGYFCEEKPHID